MKDSRDSITLIHTLDASIETFAQIRTPDALCTAAFDTLKQARAMIAQALQEERRVPLGRDARLEPALARG